MEKECVWSFRPVDQPNIHDINEIDETKARRKKSITERPRASRGVETFYMSIGNVDRYRISLIAFSTPSPLALEFECYTGRSRNSANVEGTKKEEVSSFEFEQSIHPITLYGISSIQQIFPTETKTEISGDVTATAKK